jgi:hypothetical protein
MLEGGMNTKHAKPAKPATKKSDPKTTKRRSSLRLGLLVVAALLLAGGGGYACWITLAPSEADAASEAAGEAGPDAMQVSAVATALEAETSFTHAYALAVLIAPRCGTARVPALKAASEAEAKEDGMLASLSWQAAARRVSATTERSCDYLRAEVISAERKAIKLAKAGAKSTAGH